MHQILYEAGYCSFVLLDDFLGKTLKQAVIPAIPLTLRKYVHVIHSLLPSLQKKKIK
jgi:hypothetical protein